MEEANKGVPKKDRAPPPGYKLAIAKARDATKAAAAKATPKPKSDPKKLSPLHEDDIEPNAEDSSDSDIRHSGAMRPLVLANHSSLPLRLNATIRSTDVVV